MPQHSATPAAAARATLRRRGWTSWVTRRLATTLREATTVRDRAARTAAPRAIPRGQGRPRPGALFASAFERLRARGASLGGAAIAGTVLLQLPAQLACVDAPELATGEQHDWAQYEGQRNTSMVAYTGAWWSVCTQPNTRFGCGSYEVLV